MIRLRLCFVTLLAGGAIHVSAQQNPQPPQEDKRILWIFTNHRTTSEAEESTTLTAHQKFAIAWDDATDRAIFLQTAILAGIGQWENSNPSLGQGFAGYAKRFGTTYGDFAIEDVTTESLFPTLFHQDPRYFRRDGGTSRSKVYYALSRIFITRTDSGGTQVNYSEIVGAAASVAISNAYYPDGRTAGTNLERYAEQLGFDAASNVLKQFWPSLKRKLPRWARQS